MRTSRNAKSCRAPRVPIIPKEIIEIVERGQMLISGVTGIDDYASTMVRIRTAKGVLQISGNALTLCWAGEKRLLLKGALSEIAFLLR